jgi:hypothetical protein
MQSGSTRMAGCLWVRGLGQVLMSMNSARVRLLQLHSVDIRSPEKDHVYWYMIYMVDLKREATVLGRAWHDLSILALVLATK